MTNPEIEETVVVGIIDDALAFAHERFRIGAGTRIEYIWLQDGVYMQPGVPAYSGSPPVDYGIELAKKNQGAYQGIDWLLLNCTHAGVVDEDEVYRRAGLIDFRREGHKAAAWRIAHGTHVMDIACGADPAKVADTRPIVCVQLPAMTTADTSGADLHTYALDAIEYILLRADEIARARGVAHLPVVINFSYGMVGGPHDGTSELEAAMDAIVDWRKCRVGAPLEIVLPGGNSHLSRCHATVAFQAKDEVVDLPWRILPDDWTSSFIEIWMPCRPPEDGAESRVEVTVMAPGGRVVFPALGEDPTWIYEWPASAPVCAARYLYIPAGTDRGMFLISVAPTHSVDSSMATAPCGTWTIRLKNICTPLGEPIQLWVRRDDTLHGHPRRGRQSHFDVPNYRRFDGAGRDEESDAMVPPPPPGTPPCPVQRTGLLNAIATGDKPVVVGAFLRQEMGPSKYSAGGPITPPCATGTAHRDGPDALAVGDDSRVRHGVLAAGSRSGSIVAMNGTSVAAPQITREIADLMAKRLPSDRWAVQAIAAGQEGGPPPRPNRPTQQRGGAGRILLPSRARAPR